MTLFFFLLLVEAVLWAALAGLRSISLMPSGISGYELERRIKAGDEQAAAIKQHEQALPDVRVLKYIVETLLLVIFIAVAVISFELWFGVPLAVIACLYIEPATRLKFLASRAQQVYEQNEPRIIAFVARHARRLRWLRPAEGPMFGQFVYSKEELLERLRSTSGVLSKDDMAIMQHALQFSGKTAGQVMTPRSVIDAIEMDGTLGPVALDKLHNSGHSRFPVYNKDIDHMVGMLYLHDLVPLKKNVKTVADAMHKDIFYIREDHHLEHALAAFLRTRRHLFIVVNEYRETVGLLSLEDVIEALLGRKIVDEFDQHDDLRAVATRNPRGNNLPVKRKDV